MKRKSITAMVLFALTALLCATAFAEKLDYTLSEDGTLIISGNGAITQPFMAPLVQAHGETVQHIVVEEGITSIESFGLEGFINLKSITLPQTLTEVGFCILGSKGALDYTIFGADPEALRQLLGQSYEDYQYFCHFKAQQAVDASSGAAALLNVPASAVVDALCAELSAGSLSLTLTSAQSQSDTHGNIRFVYDLEANDEVFIQITSFNAETLQKIAIRTETLSPGATFEALCRRIPQAACLAMPQGIQDALAKIPLSNGGGISQAQADGWSVRVGGVMDVRTVWDLTEDGAI